MASGSQERVPFRGDRSGSETPADPLALRAAWEENRRWVAAVLLAHKPAWADLEDLLQEVAATLVASSAELRDPASLRSWLRTVAINAARLAGRKGRLRNHRSLDLAVDGSQAVREPADTLPAAPAALAVAEEASRIGEMAMALPEGYREPLLLKAVQGLSYRQIGQILGLPETTVETRIARARRMLREQAQAATGEPSGRISHGEGSNA